MVLFGERHAGLGTQLADSGSEKNCVAGFCSAREEYWPRVRGGPVEPRAGKTDEVFRARRSVVETGNIKNESRFWCRTLRLKVGKQCSQGRIIGHNQSTCRRTEVTSGPTGHSVALIAGILLPGNPELAGGEARAGRSQLGAELNGQLRSSRTPQRRNNGRMKFGRRPQPCRVRLD